MKRPSTIEKQNLIQSLKATDYKMKFKSTSWNEEVTLAFNVSSSYCFEDLVYNDIEIAKALMARFSKQQAFKNLNRMFISNKKKTYEKHKTDFCN